MTATARSQPLVVISTSAPAVLNGKPVAPSNWATFTPTFSATQGAHHIRAQDPKPVWDGSGWVYPPPSTAKPWKARWVVDDLPNPPSGSFYWLGEPSTADGTIGIESGARQWKPHASTSSAPIWRSFFPFKPSVRAFDAWLPGGDVVHHPKGVHFNPHYIEHMWCDFGTARRQPFTWVIAAMITNHPTPHYRHFLLDSGRNPDAVGFPRLSATDVNTPRRINEGLSYRTALATTHAYEIACTRLNLQGGRTLRARATAHSRPKMFYGVYNGASSLVGARDTGADLHRRGRLDNGPDQQHRFYVLGREHGWIAQGRSGAMMVLEIRYWDYALSDDDLDGQYKQLSSTYQFDRYRRL